MEFFKKAGKTVSEFFAALGEPWLPLVARIFIAVFPKPTRGRGLAYRMGYATKYYRLEQVVINWHIQQLEKLDPAFREKQAEEAYGNAVDAAQLANMSAHDPLYPSFQDFCPPRNGTWLSKMIQGIVEERSGQGRLF